MVLTGTILYAGIQSVLRERALSEYAQRHVYIGTSASAGIRPDVTRVYCMSCTCQCTSLEYTIIVRKLAVGKRPTMLSVRRTGDSSSPTIIDFADLHELGNQSVP